MAPDRNVILDTIRERICLIPPGEFLVLKEKQLADEFGLSRTPIRQLLQVLASEGMLEVRAGYGSITTVLREADRAKHLEVYKQLSLATKVVLGKRPLVEAARMELAAIDGFGMGIEEPNPELFVRLHGRLVHAMTVSIEDTVLRHAMQAAQWRVVRWRTDDLLRDVPRNWSVFKANIQTALKLSLHCTASELLDMAVGAGERYKAPDVYDTI